MKISVTMEDGQSGEIEAYPPNNTLGFLLMHTPPFCLPREDGSTTYHHCRFFMIEDGKEREIEMWHRFEADARLIVRRRDSL